ncbi:MAG TPA: hypothetical protein VGU20_18250 [Stellaceae bacterium]|nr:hypothetical protein [Stellaceae bacterium]
MGAGLGFGLEVAADDGLLTGLRPLNGEGAVSLADDAVAGFHVGDYGMAGGRFATSAFGRCCLSLM